MTLTDRELATVLGALRTLQAIQEGDVPPQLLAQFDEHQPLTSSEIDSLCERLERDSAALASYGCCPHCGSPLAQGVITAALCRR